MSDQKVPLPQLITDGYRPTTFDYNRGTISRAARIDVFRASLPTFKRHALISDLQHDPDERDERIAVFEALYMAALARVEASNEEVNCLSLCRERDEVVRSAGYGDIFLSCKNEENEAALQLLPSLIQNFDEDIRSPERWEMALRGVLAGNLFDLGAAASAAKFDSGKGGGAASFETTRQALLPRPWVVDNLDEMLLCISGYRSVVMFVDNAGSDVILGMIPLAREFLKNNAHVILAANEGFTLNDITAVELKQVVTRVSDFDRVVKEALAAKRLTVISSGSSDPVIDLSLVSMDLADLTIEAKVDLVILEGMGRAIETNLYARFKCDAFKLGMVKHPEVAQSLGGRLYDCVCKLDKLA